MLGGLALERARKPPRASEERCGLGSGGCVGGSRFDPPDNVRPLQRALRLKELADFPQGAMHDQVDANSAEERGFELLSFLELFGPACSPFPAREAGWPPSNAQADNSGCSGSLFAPATLLQNTAGQVSGFLSPAPLLSASMERISDR